MTLMERSCFLFLTCVTILLMQSHTSSNTSATVLNITSDQSALLTLKDNIIDDPHNVLKNWSTSISVCRWFGVTCGSRHHRVTALDLSSMDLAGSIPPHMGNLSFLVSLSLKNNTFLGCLPNELSHLCRIQNLSLGLNYFDGEIPSWLGQLSKLQNLNLFSNYFVGSIPESLSNISSLQEIDLAYNQLSGSIPPQMGNLSLLKSLSLCGNNFTGSIPQSLSKISSLLKIRLGFNQLSGSISSPILNMSALRVIVLTSNKLSGGLLVDGFHHLPNLQYLSLSYNQFHGELPTSLFECKNLQVLQLGHNNLSGSIPSTMFKCRQLRILSLSSNHFVGRLPLEIGNLTMATELHLDENYFEGAIPIEIGNLQKLEVLEASLNHFTGLIPSEIFNISTIKTISMPVNNLSGHLPSNIGLFIPNLRHLSLGDNKLSGTIPGSISNASQLTMLVLGENSFSGLVPKAFRNLKLLQVLYLQNNNLTIESSPLGPNFLFHFFSSLVYLKELRLSGNPLNNTLPTSIGNLSSSLQVLHIENCNIKGNIPNDIGNLTNLMNLSLGFNDLFGSIPSTIGKLYNLQGFYVQNNALEGPIPPNICHLERLDSLYLSNNKLSGPIPLCLYNLTSLRHLFLDSNQINSTIPWSLWSLTYILKVNISSNALNGTLPLEIKNLEVLIELDLSRNYLSGDLPQVVDNFKDVKYFSLANNQLKGSIPDSISRWVSLEFLDLSNNQLSGEIPKSLEALLYLKYLNVSFNRLQGKIPIGGPFVHFSATSFVSNDGLCGASRLQVPPCKGVSQPLKYILPIVGLTMVVAVIVLIWKRQRNRNVEFQVERDLPYLPTWRRISHQELIQATNGFSANNFLGEGSFASVYKGKLLDGMNIVAKVLDLEVEGALQVFSVECEILCNIRHRNLVKIISICSNMNFKALILEYMPNGSLEKWLHSQNSYLNIFQRLNIMVDVASALEYLHYGYPMPIVHCDLKPSNVLLDENMVAHVADFGIAKLLGDVNSMMQTMTLATIGYMAPEYGSRGIVSTRGDVYSFGILLIETFTRKKPTDVMFTGEMSLKHWVKESLTISITKVIDSNLLIVEKDHAFMEDFMLSIMELALSCCAELPNQRINAKTILITLNKVKSKFLQGAQVI